MKESDCVPYTADRTDYRKLRMHDYRNYGRMIAINSLSTPELVEYFVKSLADSYPNLNFNIIDHGNFDISILCNDKCIYQGSYLDVERLFRQSSDLLLDTLKEELSEEDVL